MEPKELDSGQGYTVLEDGDDLVIRVHTKSRRTSSASGKSDVVATTRGNVPVKMNGETFQVGLNVYVKK